MFLEAIGTIQFNSDNLKLSHHHQEGEESQGYL